MYFARLVGVIPQGIGLALLWFFGFGSSHEFGSPPLSVRILGSIIALGWVILGLGSLFMSAETLQKLMKAQQKGLLDAEQRGSMRSTSPLTPGKLKCPNCGASPQTGEVSPHGDVKCDHCSRWYNVHTA